MKRYKFIFVDGETFLTIAKDFREACLNADHWMSVNGYSAKGIEAMLEW